MSTFGHSCIFYTLIGKLQWDDTDIYTEDKQNLTHCFCGKHITHFSNDLFDFIITKIVTKKCPQEARQGQKLEVGFVTSLSKASKLFYKCYFYCTFQDKHVLKSIDQMQVQKDKFLVVFSERDRPQISSSEWETSRVWGTLLQNLCLLNCSALYDARPVAHRSAGEAWM